MLHRRYFRNISIVVVSSLIALAAVQLVWVWKMYDDSVTDFRRRVESAMYKSIYKSFRMDAIPGMTDATYIKMDLDDFALYFEPNLLELDAFQPYHAEIIFNDVKPRAMMSRGDKAALERPMTTETMIDDEGDYTLRLSIEMPSDILLGRMWGLIFSSVAIILLIAAVLFYLVRTMYRQKTLEEMRRDFTHNITHELKTPISVAVTATDALRNFSADADVERRSRYLEIVENQLSQLSTMVEHILSVSVEGREYRFNPILIEIDRIISQITGSVEMNNGKKTDFRISCPEGTIITADEFHIRNLLATLIDNAVKYSDDPVVWINVIEESGRLSIIIKDNGCGISKEHLPHVFEKFYRVPTGDIHSVRGYGLGLYYAKQVAVLHKGTISMESQPGKGTTVTVILPRDER